MKICYMGYYIDGLDVVSAKSGNVLYNGTSVLNCKEWINKFGDSNPEIKLRAGQKLILDK